MNHRRLIVLRSLALCLPTLFALTACEEKNPPTRYVGKDPAPSPSAQSAPKATPSPAPAPPAARPTPTGAAGDASPPPARAATPPPSSTPGETVNAAGLAWTIPAGWASRPPASAMRKAEFVAPAPAPAGAQGGEDAEVVVSWFGAQGAGPVEANLERRARQVIGADGQPVKPEIESFTGADLTITMLSSTGQFQSGMPGQTTTPKPGFTLLAAVIEGGADGPVYVRMTGPQSVVAHHKDAFTAMLRTLRRPG